MANVYESVYLFLVSFTLLTNGIQFERDEFGIPEVDTRDREYAVSDAHTVTSPTAHPTANPIASPNTPQSDVGTDFYTKWSCPIPYAIDTSVSNSTSMIIAAMNYITEKTEWSFIERTTESDYLNFQDDGSGGCWSYLGRIGGGQQVQLEVNRCPFGTVMHEIGHALGIPHEQSRADRDDFVTIDVSEICCGASGNFDIANATFNPGDYDFNSIMHYDQWAFNKDDDKTIIPYLPLPAGVCWIGQRAKLSDDDIDHFNLLVDGTGCGSVSQTCNSANVEICGAESDLGTNTFIFQEYEVLGTYNTKDYYRSLTPRYTEFTYIYWSGSVWRIYDTLGGSSYYAYNTDADFVGSDNWQRCCDSNGAVADPITIATEVVCDSSNTGQPSVSPTEIPSASPVTSAPTTHPSVSPTTSAPTQTPSSSPITNAPTQVPSASPITDAPTKVPSASPVTSAPTSSPITSAPTTQPTVSPITSAPTQLPSVSPISSAPTEVPSASPTHIPSASPVTSAPTTHPSASPITSAPTQIPSSSPITNAPTQVPSQLPSVSPVTLAPTQVPSASPTKIPSASPITSAPTTQPTASPTTDAPTKIPSASPVTSAPTSSPITSAPTTQPTVSPTTSAPTQIPTVSPITNAPTQVPSASPTTSEPSVSPSVSPITNAPTDVPTTTAPTALPTGAPTENPSTAPTTASPTAQPTNAPTTMSPTRVPTANPTTNEPSVSPTNIPSASPVTAAPTTTQPSSSPSASPTTNEPSKFPTAAPIDECGSYCDAFAVILTDYTEQDGDIVCLSYTVSRQFDTGDCADVTKVKKIILGFGEDCGDQTGEGCNHDLEITECAIYEESSRRRRLKRNRNKRDSHEDSDGDSDSDESCDDSFKVTNSGIRVKMRVKEERQFRFCVNDVFVDPEPITVNSDVTLFTNGGIGSPFQCEGSHLEGLPCLFRASASANAQIIQKSESVKHEIEEEQTDDNKWGIFSKLDSYMLWTLVCVFVVFGLLIAIVCVCVCVSVHKKKKFENKDVIDVRIEKARTSQLQMNQIADTIKTSNIVPSVSDNKKEGIEVV